MAEDSTRSHHYIIGTAGHIDHGKSTLIEKLTGTDPDRLPEEKQRGMTIELGFASLSMETTDGSGDRLELGVVDVPGHADFVKNMVAGVGAIDLALFIVAADDGWMPQTEEHYQILRYLGLERVVVALTKIDLAEDLDLVLEDVRENLEDGGWSDAPVVPVSAHTGEGIDELRQTIASILTEAPPVRSVGKPRLPVDRAFSLKGVGTVVTGTLADGDVRVGSDLVAQPSGENVHVRSVQSHNQAAEISRPGTRTALNLAGIGVRESHRHSDGGVGRGDVLTLPGLGGPVEAIDVLVEKSSRAIRGMRRSTKAIRTGRQVMFHHGSAGIPARIHFLRRRKLDPGESGVAELRFKEPIYVFAGDRFVLRDASLGYTLAGGVVLDEDANRRVFRKPFQGEFLRVRSENPDDLATLVRTQLIRDRVVFVPRLLAKSHFSDDEIAEEVASQVKAGMAKRSGDWAFEAEWWGTISDLAAEKIDVVHRDNPEQLGMPLRDLRGILGSELPGEKFFDMVIEGLVAGEFVKAGPNIRRRDFNPRLPNDLAEAGERVRTRLSTDPINPPNKGETATNPPEEKALRFLVHTGEVIELDPKTVISKTGFDLIRDQIAEYLRENEKATASVLRQHTGTVRRILMPLLEMLDDEGLTVREGDDRRLKS